MNRQTLVNKIMAPAFAIVLLLGLLKYIIEQL
jgi:hypothetical protein